MVDARIRDDLIRHLDRLAPDQQQRVLDFARKLGAPREGGGASGEVLLRHFGVMGASDVREILEAVEAGCERVDASEW